MITVDNVIVALTNFMQPIVGSVEIVRAQVNRVSMPDEPCIVLTELLQHRLSTTVRKSDDPNTIYTTPTRIDIQIDFYSPTAGDMCRAVETLFRSDYSPTQFPDDIKPLYCSDGIQSPLITGEQQWESRWTLTASLQYNSPIVVTQEYFDTVGDTDLIAADVQFGV